MTKQRMKKTVLVVTGTRAEYGLLRPTMRAIAKSKKLSLRVLVTGMHTLAKHGNSQELVLKDFPSACVVPVGEGDSMTDALAKEIMGISAYCEADRPNLILVLGDRDESFAGAIVGGHLGIPVAHIHGGDKTGSVVDEYIRHATTKFAHLHFAATKKSAHRIKLLGEESWRIHMVGGPGLDELRSLKLQPKSALAKRYGLSTTEPWYVLLHHPTSLDTVSLETQIRPLLKVAQSLPGEKIVLYPNSDKGSDVFIDAIDTYRERPDFHIFQNIPREDLISILKYATLLVGNSSMGIIDASCLRLPTVNVGDRQAGRERGANVVDVGYDEASIRRGIARAMSPTFRSRVARGVSPYGDGHAAEKIVRVLEQSIDRADLFHKKLTYV